MTSHAAIPRPKKPNKGNSKRTLYAVAAGFLIFALGVNVGNGRISFDDKQAVAKQLPADLDYATVEALYDNLRVSFDGELNHESLMDGLKHGLASASGDPYTEYFSSSEAKEFDEDMKGVFTGIGAELGKEGEAIEVMTPIAGFPAEKAGLKAKDIIVEVDGESTAGLTINEVVKKIRGDANTKVKLKIIRGAQELDFEIIRAQIAIPSVKSEIIDGNIGVLTVSRFGPDTTALATEAANAFKKANVKGVVLDLRNNPGGELDESVGLSSLWLDRDKTVLSEKRDGKIVKTFKATGNPILKGIKTAVLINEGSASASEIVAGALKENKVATLFGTKTYGKGSVQELQPQKDGGLLKVTIARWFTPSGKGIDKAGLEPDKKVDRTEDDFKNGRDPQRDAAVADLK